jgi:proton glutamate symport protein
VVGAAVGWWIGSWAIAQVPPQTHPDEVGAVAGQIAQGSGAYLMFRLIGDLFLRGLQLIIVPLVVSSIVLAVVNMGSGAAFGRLGIRTLVYYLCTSMIAILLGLTLVNLVQPGVSGNGAGILQDRDLSAFETEQRTVDQRTAGRGLSDFLDVFRQMVPPNIFSAASDNGQLLGLIVVALVFGYFLARLETGAQPVLLTFMQGVYDITLRITELVLKLAPLGVLGLLAYTVAEQHARLAPDGRFREFAAGIVTFAVVALAALLIHFAVTMPLILSLVARVNPLRHYQAMAPALLTAFSTASSSATLPVTIDCVERRAGVSNEKAGFILPLGATVNMDGTALYECVAAIFVCQAFGIELTFAQQVMIVVVALLTSVGVAGVPAASLVAIVVILNAVQAQLPEHAPLLVAGMGLLMVFDRPLDMCRTALNIFSDSVGAVTIARMEGEAVLQSPREPGRRVS